jgi:hypothetical protein
MEQTKMSKHVEIVVLVALLTGSAPVVAFAQSTDPGALIKAALLPLPEPLRGGATVVNSEAGGKYTVLRKGTNDMVCIHEPSEGAGRAYQSGKVFWVHCYNESIFAWMKRRAELANDFARAGKTVDAKVLNDAVESEIKSGKLKLPAHPTTGFQMRGPMSGYNAAANTVSSEIKSWQMVIIPYATGASLSLPEEPTPGLPWVMGAGSAMAHIMVEH